MPRLREYKQMLIEVTFSPYPRIWWSDNWTGNTLFGYNTLVNITASGSILPGGIFHAPSGDQSPGGDDRFSGGVTAENQCTDAISAQTKRLLARAKSHPTIGARSSVVCTGLSSGNERMVRNSCGNLEFLPLGSTPPYSLLDGARATWEIYPEIEMDLLSTKKRTVKYEDPETGEEREEIIEERKVNNAVFTIWAGSLNTQKPPDNYYRPIPTVYKKSRDDEDDLYQQGHHITNIKIKYDGATWNSNGGWSGTKAGDKKHLIQLQHVSTEVMKNDGKYQPYHCQCYRTGTAVLDIEVFRGKYDDRFPGAPQPLPKGQLFKTKDGSSFSPKDVERSITWPMPIPWRTICWEEDWESPTDAHLGLNDADAERTYNSCAKADLLDVAIAWRANIGCDFEIDASDMNEQGDNEIAGPANLTRSYECQQGPSNSYDGETKSKTATWGPTGNGWSTTDFGTAERECVIAEWLGENGTNPFNPATIPYNAMWNKLNGKAFNTSVPVIGGVSKTSYRWFNSGAYSESVLDVRSMMYLPAPGTGSRSGRWGSINHRRIQYAIGLPNDWNYNPDMVVPIQANWLEVTASLGFWQTQQTLYPNAFRPPPSAEVAYTGAGVFNIRQRSWQYDGGGKMDSGWIDLPAPNLVVASAVIANNAKDRIFNIQTRVVNLTYDRIGNYCPNGVEKPDQSSIKDSDIETRIPDTVPGSTQKGTQTRFNTPKESTYDHISAYYIDRSDKPAGDEPNYPNSSFEYYSTTDLAAHFPPQNSGETYESYRDTDGAVVDSSKTLKPKPPQ